MTEEDKKGQSARGGYSDFSLSLRKSAAMKKYLSEGRGIFEVDSSAAVSEGVKLPPHSLPHDQYSNLSSPNFMGRSEKIEGKLSKGERHLSSPTFPPFSLGDVSPTVREDVYLGQLPKPSVVIAATPQQEEEKEDIIPARGTFSFPLFSHDCFTRIAFVTGNFTEMLNDLNLAPICITDLDADPHLAVSSIKILMIFQKWLVLMGSRVQGQHFLPVMFLRHLTSLGDDLSPLFTLERWMREKMKVAAQRESKFVLFRQWATFSGVSAAGRLHHERRLRRKGYEAWLEFRLRRHMKRQTPLQLYAHRRFQTLEAREEASSPEGNRKSKRGQGVRQKNDRVSLRVLPVRHVLEKAQTVYKALLRQHGPSFFLVDMSTSSNRLDSIDASHHKLVKQAEYNACQDLIALYLAFRRLLSRTYYSKRFREITRKRHYQIYRTVWIEWCKGWKSINNELLIKDEQARQGFVRILNIRKEHAFYKLLNNVEWSRKERKALSALREKIVLHRACIQSLYMLAMPVFIRCFMHWKANAEVTGVSKAMRILAHGCFRKRSCDRLIKRWKEYSQRTASHRMKTLRGRERKAILQATGTKSLGDHGGDDGIMPYCTRRIGRKLDELSAVRHFFDILRSRAQRPKVFSSLLEMKFYQHLRYYSDLLDNPKRYKALTPRLFSRVASGHQPQEEPSGSKGESTKTLLLIFYDKDSCKLRIIEVPPFALASSSVGCDDYFDSSFPLNTSISSMKGKHGPVVRFMLSTARRLDELYDRNAKLTAAAGLFSPSKGPLPVSEYLGLLGKKGVVQLRGESGGLPSGRMQCFLHKWCRFIASRRFDKQLSEVIRQRNQRIQMNCFMKAWHEAYRTQSVWRRIRQDRTFKQFQRYSCSRSVMHKSQKVATFKLMREGIFTMQNFLRRSTLRRFEANNCFCNRLLDGSKGRFVSFIHNTEHSTVSDLVKTFYSTCLSFRFGQEDVHLQKKLSSSQPNRSPFIVHVTVKGRSQEVSAPSLARALSKAKDTFQTLRRALRRILGFSRRMLLLHHSHEIWSNQRKIIAFRRLRRHRYYGRLRKRLRLRKLHGWMLLWKMVCSRRKHIKSTLKHHVMIWRSVYARNVYMRVWEHAWGKKIRLAMAKWLAFCKHQDVCAARAQKYQQLSLLRFVTNQWRMIHVAHRHHRHALSRIGWESWKFSTRQDLAIQQSEKRATFYHTLRRLENWKRHLVEAAREVTREKVADEWFIKTKLLTALAQLSPALAQPKFLVKRKWTLQKVLQHRCLAEIAEWRQSQLSSRVNDFTEINERFHKVQAAWFKPSRRIIISRVQFPTSITEDDQEPSSKQDEDPLEDSLRGRLLETWNRPGSKQKEMNKRTPFFTLPSSSEAHRRLPNSQSEVTSRSQQETHSPIASTTVKTPVRNGNKWSSRRQNRPSDVRSHLVGQAEYEETAYPEPPFLVSNSPSKREKNGSSPKHQDYLGNHDNSDEENVMLYSSEDYASGPLSGRIMNSLSPQKPGGQRFFAASRPPRSPTSLAASSPSLSPSPSPSKRAVSTPPRTSSASGSRFSVNDSAYTSRRSQSVDPAYRLSSSVHSSSKQNSLQGRYKNDGLKPDKREDSKSGGLFIDPVLVGESASSRSPSPPLLSTRSHVTIISPLKTLGSNLSNSMQWNLPSSYGVGTAAPRGGLNAAGQGSREPFSPATSSPSRHSFVHSNKGVIMKGKESFSSKSRRDLTPSRQPQHVFFPDTPLSRNTEKSFARPHPSSYSYIHDVPPTLAGDHLTRRNEKGIAYSERRQNVQTPRAIMLGSLLDDLSVQLSQSVASCLQHVESVRHALLRRGMVRWHRKCLRSHRVELLAYFKRCATARRSLWRWRSSTLQRLERLDREDRFQMKAFLHRWLRWVNNHRSQRDNWKLVIYHHLIMKMKRLLRRWHCAARNHRFVDRYFLKRALLFYRRRRLALAIYKLKVPLQGSLRACATSAVEASIISGLTDQTATEDEDGDKSEDGLPYYRKLARRHHEESKTQQQQRRSRFTRKTTNDQKHGSSSIADLRASSNSLVFQLTKKLLFSNR